ncbi:hypothetical protein GCM10009715_25560 [Paeniglutamicibacter psychrophenolicus]
MGCKNSSGESPLSWDNLLIELSTEFCKTTEAKQEFESIIEHKDYLLAAEYLRYIASDTGNINHYNDKIDTLCNGPSNDPFRPSELHYNLIDLEPSVIVTTNFDSILEEATAGGWASVQFYDAHIDNSIRQGRNVLLKIHGTAKHAGKIVFTQSEYTSLRNEGSLALEVLQSLLLTKMALFVGYSFNDPDLKLILESLFGVTGRGPGHVLVMDGDIPHFRRRLFTEIYGLTVKSFPKGKYDSLLESIVELRGALASTTTGS